MKIIQIYMLGLIFAPSILFGQAPDLQVFAGSGANVGMYESWTIGEALVLSLENGNNILSQGFHQPQVGIVGIKDVEYQPNVKVFPNPTTDRCFVTLSASFTGEVVLANMWGQILVKQKIVQPVNQLELDLSGYSSGMYLLTLTASSNYRESYFRIEKLDF